ncbi:MAG TPA: chloride channel protein [Terriglobales bacterium]
MPPPRRRRFWPRLELTRHFGEALSPHSILISGYAVVVGLASGYIALGLLRLIYLLTGFFFHGQWSLAQWTPEGNHLGAWVIVIPVIGGVLVGLMIHFWEPTLKGHGIPEAMQAVLMDKSIVRGRVAFLKPLATALAIGTGGPFGAEGPIIQTGAAVGSLFGQRLGLSAYDRRVLLAAGAGGGMAATFMAPLAGLFVAVELILFEFRARSFLPVALASAMADAIALHYRGRAPMFPMPHFVLQSMHELWWFGVLGLICGLVGWGMTEALFWLDGQFDKLPLHPVAVWAPAVGGGGGIRRSAAALAAGGGDQQPGLLCVGGDGGGVRQHRARPLHRHSFFDRAERQHPCAVAAAGVRDGGRRADAAAQRRFHDDRQVGPAGPDGEPGLCCAAVPTVDDGGG